MIEPVTWTCGPWVMRERWMDVHKWVRPTHKGGFPKYYCEFGIVCVDTRAAVVRAVQLRREGLSVQTFSGNRKTQLRLAVAACPRVIVLDPIDNP